MRGLNLYQADGLEYKNILLEHIKIMRILQEKKNSYIMMR